jgi:hypothetical protein
MASVGSPLTTALAVAGEGRVGVEDGMGESDCCSLNEKEKHESEPSNAREEEGRARRGGRGDKSRSVLMLWRLEEEFSRLDGGSGCDFSLVSISIEDSISRDDSRKLKFLRAAAVVVSAAAVVLTPLSHSLFTKM